jgi:hypothetical protein
MKIKGLGLSYDSSVDHRHHKLRQNTGEFKADARCVGAKGRAREWRGTEWNRRRKDIRTPEAGMIENRIPEKVYCDGTSQTRTAPEKDFDEVNYENIQDFHVTPAVPRIEPRVRSTNE